MMMLPSAPLAAIAATILLLAVSQTSAFQPTCRLSPRPAYVNKALAAQSQEGNTLLEDALSSGARGLTATFALFVMTTLSGPAPAGAVSGGGLDYANLDITGQDFSNEGKLYKGKDFSVCMNEFTSQYSGISYLVSLIFISYMY